MVDILASHEATFETIFKAATDNEGPEQETYIPADFNCPSGGDQLTRVCFTYGRKLRAGAHTSKDRLEHSQPDVIELIQSKHSSYKASILNCKYSYATYVIYMVTARVAYYYLDFYT